MIEIEAPDGSIVEFPEGTPDTTITAVMAREFGNSQKQESPVSMVQRAGNLWEGIKSGATFSFGDELQAGIAAGTVGAANVMGMTDMTSQQAYDQALPELRQEQQQARTQTPWTYGLGEVGGAISTGAGLAKAAPQTMGAITQYAGKGLPQALGTAAGIGGVSGGVYGFGSGQGGFEQRMQNAQQMGMYGGAGGLAGVVGAKAVSAAVGPLTRRVMGLIEKRKATKVAPSVTGMTPEQTLGQLVQKTQDAQQLTYGDAVNSKALNQVTQALKADYPDNYEQILSVWKDSNQPLASVAGPALTRKAMGAAQYESALPKTVKFFQESTTEAKDKVLQSIYKNVGDSRSFYLTADDVLAKGRKKAAPLYDKAYNQTVDLTQIKPEITQAIEKARKQYPSELDSLPDNSIKVLDYAKKVLDDDIGAAKRSGEGNFARSRTEIKNELLSQIDNQSPDYAKARAVSGDYLQLMDAMEVGQTFDKFDPYEVTQLYKKASQPEKEAFKLGFSKKISDQINNASEGKNPYDRVFGSKSKQERLKAILSPDEYKKLEIDMRSTNRLFDMQRTVLGGSPTASKSLAALELSNDELINIATQPKNALKNWVTQKLGMGDKVASGVADLLYETDPTKKLVLLERVAGNKGLSQEEKKLVKEYYFSIADKQRVLGATAGGQQAASLPEATIRAQDYQEQQ